MKSRLLTVISYLAAIVIGFYYRNDIIGWLQDGDTPLGLVFLAAVGLALLPVIPYKIVIGLFGLAYGTLAGALLGWLAAAAGSVIVYGIVRAFYKERGRAYLSRFDRLEKLQRSFERHPFRTLVVARMIPVLPQSLVNIYSSLLSIPLVTYAVASALGKIPAMLVYAYIGQHLFSDWRRLLAAFGVYAAFLLLTFIVYRRRTKEEEPA